MTDTDRVHDDEEAVDYKGLRSDDVDADAEHEVDEMNDSRPYKKQKLAKALDKKYPCRQVGCGKSYSRAEHLYRHQLNHTPKTIYRCDHLDCDRWFVRADLCARHKDRHTNKGSHLQRREAFLNSQRADGNTSSGLSPPGATTTSRSPPAASHEVRAPTDGPYSTREAERPSTSAAADQAPGALSNLAPLNTNSNPILDPQLSHYASYPGSLNGSQQSMMPQSAPATDRRFSYDGSFVSRPASQAYGFHQQQGVAMNQMPPPLMSSPQAGAAGFPQPPYASPASTNQTYRSSSSLSTMQSLPAYGFQQAYGPSNTGSRSYNDMSPPNMNVLDSYAVSNSSSNTFVDFNTFDQMGASYAMPVFGGDTPLNRSPPLPVDENLFNMLFSNNGMEVNDPSPPEIIPEPAPPDATMDEPLPKPEPDDKTDEQSSSLLSDGLDINIPQSMISEKEQIRLVNLVRSFGEIEESSGRWTSADILAGNPNDANFVMSLHMLKTYLTSFWHHIHQQMPILHRPTFNPETCPDLLLLAMMCLGATCLERTHSMEMTQASAEFAFFVAHHVRWEIFKDEDFRPAAKLWTFQTMLLLELFEKMFSTRALHERGHIHHATTLTVMRRGSSLIGRSAIESPTRKKDPTRTPPGPDGSINTAGQNMPDAWWNRWITAEATRRAAFAAFVIDSTHATLFGHSAVMSPHDLRLPLPCDEALWSATSSAEVQRVEASLTANGFRNVSFLEGLRRTLNGLKVRTNTFGRLILMAGLLNVSFHMNQQDLQVSSLGASATLGKKATWSKLVTNAFDHWRRDFDDSLAKNDHWLHVCKPKNNEPCPLDHHEVVFESRTCLHSLAHMAMHVDIIDCQVFAGAEHVLGRFVTEGDRNAVRNRMREHWAPSARARDAVFYALRFLSAVLLPEEDSTTKHQHPHQTPTISYSAHNDYLLNRPWVLFFAALIVWCYGFALDGPIRSSTYDLTTRESQIVDCQNFLIRMGGIEGPVDLDKLTDRNSCLGLLLLLQEEFQQPRWELMHEAADTIGECINQLSPGRSNGQR